MKPLLPTEHNDQVVIRAYGRWREHGDRTAIKGAANTLGVAAWAVRHRGRELGLARTREAPWGPEEITLLEEWRWMGDKVISRKFAARGFRRTPTAVHLKIKRLRLKPGIDGYTLRQLGVALGVDHHAIHRWIKAGWLKGSRRGTDRKPEQGGDMWYFPHTAVHNFAMQHPDEIDLCKVEKFWFLDLITNGRICA